MKQSVRLIFVLFTFILSSNPTHWIDTGKGNTMKFYLLLLLLLIQPKSLISQNMVPNGGFEQLSDCPDDISQSSLLLDWINPSSVATPDVYNSCSKAMCLVNVPSTFWGFEIESAQGEGFVGCTVGTKEEDYFDLYKEYLYVKLKNKLVQGTNYKFEVSLRRPPTTMVGVSFQAALLSEIVLQETFDNLELDPNLISTEAIANLNWEKYSSNYTANGDEEYLLVGNFESDYDLFFTSVSGLETEEDTCQIYDEELVTTAMYLLIDEVSLQPSEIMNTNRLPSKKRLEINWNANLGIQITVLDGVQKHISGVKLYDQTGMLLYSSNDYKQGDWIRLEQRSVKLIIASIQIGGEVLVSKIAVN